MASKLQYIQGLSEETTANLMTVHGNWRRFLETSARLYKYSYPDQLLIYAQRPDALAVAPMDLWNDNFTRWVRRGSKGIALIDDKGDYPRLKYVFDVNDTEPTLENPRPVHIWALRQEHKAAVLAELAKHYDDIDAEMDDLAGAFRKVANKLATEYYDDNEDDIMNRAEYSVLEPPRLVDDIGEVLGRDGRRLKEIFVETLIDSVAYTVMTRCGLETGELFGDDAFQGIADFNTPDMVYAIGTATSKLSEEALRDVEIVIRKYERVKAAQQAQNAERSNDEYDRNPYLQRGGRVPSARPVADGAQPGDLAAARTLRQNEEGLPEKAQDDKLQSAVADGEAVPAPAGGGRHSGDALRASDVATDGADEAARQGSGRDRLGGGHEDSPSASGGNGDARSDLRVTDNPTYRYYSTQRPVSIGTYPRNSGNPTSFENFDKRTAVENGAFMAWGWLEYDKPLTKKQLYDFELRAAPGTVVLEQPAVTQDAPQEPAPEQAEETFSAMRKSSDAGKQIEELLSTSTITLAEVDAILRDGGNDGEHSAFRIAAHFAKHLDDNGAYLQREYLRGRYSRNSISSGKGFTFTGVPGVAQHIVSAWFDETGLSLANTGNARNSARKVTIPWELAAERVKELFDAGQYVTPDELADALDNERNELAASMWNFYNDDMGGLPYEWEITRSAYPNEVALIKIRLDAPDKRDDAIKRVSGDIAAYKPEEHPRHYHDRDRLLYDVRAITHEPVYPPQAKIENVPFKYFITQDEVDAHLASGSHFAESKLRIMSFFLTNSDVPERVKFLKSEYGTGSATWSEGDGNTSHDPGRGITISRGHGLEHVAETNLKWPVVARRIDLLIKRGQYFGQREQDSMPDYERLVLARAVNNFYASLPYDEYVAERPFPDDNKLYYPDVDLLASVADYLGDDERVNATLERMRYVVENTPVMDRHYNVRTDALEKLTAFQAGTFTLFPNFDAITAPDTLAGADETPAPEAAAPADSEPAAPIVRSTDRIILSDSRHFSETTTLRGDQMSIFDVRTQTFPTVEEQRGRIENKLRQEAAEVKAASVVLEHDMDVALLDVSDADRARLAEQFTNAPRSREAVNLVKEIYGDALPFKLPEAIKRLGELAAAGKLAPPALTQTMNLQAVGDFYELTGEDAKTAADLLGLTLTARNGAPMVGFPSRVLDDYTRKMADAGFALVAPTNEDKNEPTIHRLETIREGATLEINGTRMVFGGSDGVSASYRESDGHNISGESKKISLRDLARAGYYFDNIKPDATKIVGGIPITDARKANAPAVFGYITNEQNEDWYVDLSGNRLAKTEWQLEKERAALQSAAEPALTDTRRAYAVGDVVWLDAHKFVIYEIGDYYSQPDDLTRKFAMFGYDVKLTDVTGGYPLMRSMYSAEIDYQLEFDERNAEFMPLGEVAETPEQVGAEHGEPDELDGADINDALNEPGEQNEADETDEPADTDEISEMEMELVGDPPDEPVDLDFDVVSRTVLGRVTSDEDYLKALANAQSRAALRNQCTIAVETSITGHFKDEPEVYRRYFFDDDFNDQLFDYVLKQSWENRQQAKIETVAESKAAEPAAVDGIEAQNSTAATGSIETPNSVIAAESSAVAEAPAPLGKQTAEAPATPTAPPITEFRGDNYFLSNFYRCKVEYEGVEYDNAEAAYQAAKCADVNDREVFVGVSAAAAKQMGRSVALRKDWETVKAAVMREIIRAKFGNNPELAAKLTATGDAPLTENNTWHDNYWGNCTCPRCAGIEGENRLGAILMEMRGELAAMEQDTPPFAEYKPDISLIIGSPVVLDLRSVHTGLVGGFSVVNIDGDAIKVKRDGFDISETITRAQLEQHIIYPVAERVYQDDGTDYYLFRYPKGLDANVTLSDAELRLIPEKADRYALCAEACFLSDEDMKHLNIEFCKLPRDFGLLPEAARARITETSPQYQAEWERTKDIPGIRYEVTLTSDDFPDAAGEYGVWDNETGEYVYDANGELAAFHEARQAESFVRKLNDDADNAESADAKSNSSDTPTAKTEQTPLLQPQPRAANFRITDDHLGEGGAKTKFRNNIAAIQVIQTLERESRTATANEQETLSRYVGWGGLPQAFDPDNKQWANEYAELSALLPSDEYKSARASTLNAHYTPPVVIKAMWETIGRMGFNSGNVLESSCGIGNFFGLIPGEMWQSKLYGVELDKITAQIAKQLYPNANIQQSAFEDAAFSDAFFDLAIGNVPFGGNGVADSRYDKHKFATHDYFIAKSLDTVRPGGVVAVITSKFTMDSNNTSTRRYLAQRADLLGAVRLPNNTFTKNAGTEVCMDILFLQKRDRPLDVEPDWVTLGITEDGIPCNSYFIDNPEMVCGKMALDKRMNDKYGRDDYTTCVPTEGADFAEQLNAALLNVRGMIEVDELDDLDGVDDHAIAADLGVKNYSYAVVNDMVYYRENSLMYPVELPNTTLQRIKGMVELRDCVHKFIALQMDDAPDAEIDAQQKKLNDLYDGYIAEFGLISSSANSRAFKADSAYYLLSALEILDEDGNLKRKADMFTKRTIYRKTTVTHVDTATEALAVSIGEKARVDLDYMSELSGKDRETLIEELKGVVFLNVSGTESQEKSYVTADEYLSGNIREKLKLAVAAAEVDPSLQFNVDALKAVMPEDIEAGDIAARLGSTWIDPKYVQEFIYQLLNTPENSRDTYQVKFFPYTCEWQVTNKGRYNTDVAATVTYGTKRMNAYEIIDDTLNLRDARVYDYSTDADGHEKRELNRKETTLVQQKQEIIKQRFKDWLWNDPERRQTLVKKYNETFNSVRTREYDGSHLTFEGITTEIDGRPLVLGEHQSRAIARQIYGGNTLLAHAVGAGKTFEMIAAAMEMKRLGLCQKSLIAVPKHLTEQWATEFLRLYPSANILVATEKDFEMRSRRKFCAKIATGDYDAVIIGHSQLAKIPMSRERQERLFYEQLDEIETAVKELKDSKGDHFSIKQLESLKKTLETRFKKLMNSKRDDVVTFEQLGCDRLFVDEAHNYKNLFLTTKMRNIAGLSTSEAAKSSDLYMKCRYLDERTGEKGTIFATGTPISNSISELFTLQRYLQHSTLEANGLTHFDGWVSTFADPETSIELAPEGTGYRARTRLQFYNIPELMTMVKGVADIQTADMLNLPVPEAVFENVIVEPSDLQKEMVQDLSDRAAAIHRGGVDPHIDNILKITTDGRKIGLDQRLMNPLLPDFEGSKINACTDNVFKIWNDTKADRLTQLVFCDFSTPNKDGRFNVYDDIKAKLLARGIPEDEIAFIHDADTETRKKELFAKVRQGKVRVLFGSTFKMGSGTNVQDKLIALHDADCPWRPADLEQRSGRIIRQGNLNPQVKIFRYATSGTFDSYLWQTVQKKQEFISQIMSSKSPVRSCDDVDETALSYAEIKALCAGNPLIAEKMSLDNEVARLRLLRAEHKSLHFRLEDDLAVKYPAQVKSVEERIVCAQADKDAYEKEQKRCFEVIVKDGAADVTQKFPGMVLNGVNYTEKEPAAKALLECCAALTSTDPVPVGEYMGFKMSLLFDKHESKVKIQLRGKRTYEAKLGSDAFGNIQRINNALDNLPDFLIGLQDEAKDIQRQIEAAKIELAIPFGYEAELAEKEERLACVNVELNIDGGDHGMDVINDDDRRDKPAADIGGEDLGDDEAGSVDAYDSDSDEPVTDEDDADECVGASVGGDNKYKTAVFGGSPIETKIGLNNINPGRVGEKPAERAGNPVTRGENHNATYPELRRTGTYGRGKPSILDDLLDADAESKASARGGGKSSELNI